MTVKSRANLVQQHKMARHVSYTRTNKLLKFFPILATGKDKGESKTNVFALIRVILHSLDPKRSTQAFCHQTIFYISFFILEDVHKYLKTSNLSLLL